MVFGMNGQIEPYPGGDPAVVINEERPSIGGDPHLPAGW